MGKVYKRKRHSCKLCKPHKMGWEKRYTKKEQDKRKRMEKESNENN